MDIPKDVLENVVYGVKLFLAEYEMMSEVKRLCMQKVPTYAKSLHNMSVCVENLQSIKTRGLLNHRSISFSILEILALELGNLNSSMIKVKKWNNMRAGKKGCWKFVKKIFYDSPSKINNLLIESLDKIMPNLHLISELESSIFGSSIRIDNEILRDAWMMMGSNQLNDSSIDKNLLIENLYLLLKLEIGDVKRPEYWKKKINTFVETLDGNISSSDGFISVAELNEIPEKYKKYNKITDLLIDITSEKPVLLLKNTTSKEPEVLEKDEKNLDIDFKPMSIDYDWKLNVPHCEGYGSASDWKANVFAHFVVQENDNKQLLNVELTVKAIDQGWGGTGHCQIRYQVNENMPIVGCSINRENSPDSIYKFSIGGDKLKIGNNVKIWGFCPPWGGWKLNVSEIEAKAIFM